MRALWISLGVLVVGYAMSFVVYRIVEGRWPGRWFPS
jgi:hypothetical protein